MMISRGKLNTLLNLGLACGLAFLGANLLSIPVSGLICGLATAYFVLWHWLAPLFRVRGNELIYFGAALHARQVFRLNEITRIILFPRLRHYPTARLLTIECGGEVNRIWIPAIFDEPIAGLRAELRREFGARYVEIQSQFEPRESSTVQPEQKRRAFTLRPDGSAVFGRLSGQIDYTDDIKAIFRNRKR